MSILFAEEMMILFAILTIGTWIGQFSLKGISLGSAGVLFVGMVFGHFGLNIPKEVMDLGLLLFVYSVGLQSGPSFFRMFRRSGTQFLVTALITVLVGAIITVIITFYMHLPFDLAAGLYAGSLTTTPGMAAAINTVEDTKNGLASNVSVGYGISYPYGTIFLVLVVQFLPFLIRRNLKKEEEQWLDEQKLEMPSLAVKQFLITNPNCDGKSLMQLNLHSISLANISRIKHMEEIFTASPEFILHIGDVVMAVGAEGELAKLGLIFGEETEVPMEITENILSIDVDVTENKMVGKKISQLNVGTRYGVIITRIKRQGLELTPTGGVILEMGDTLHIVGNNTSVKEFAELVSSGQPGKANETNMITFLLGMLLGICFGSIPFEMVNGVTIKLGNAGGVFLVSLLIGHFGTIGSLRLYVPQAAKNLSRDLGLMLFLAGAGTKAGSTFISVIEKQGWSLLFAGVIITTLSAIAGLLVMTLIYKMNILSIMGAIAATMTSSPGLAAVMSQSKTDLPSLSYASVYPLALIFKVIIVQILVEILSRFQYGGSSLLNP